MQVTHRAISAFLIKQAELERSQATIGAVTLIQRFRSATNWIVHLHGPVVDGIFRTSGDVTAFHPVRAPSIEQLQILLNQIIKRVMNLLTRRGYLIEEQGMIFTANTDTDTAMAPLQSAACTYRIALGPRAGQKVLSL